MVFSSPSFLDEGSKEFSAPVFRFVCSFFFLSLLLFFLLFFLLFLLVQQRTVFPLFIYFIYFAIFFVLFLLLFSFLFCLATSFSYFPSFFIPCSSLVFSTNTAAVWSACIAPANPRGHTRATCGRIERVYLSRGVTRSRKGNEKGEGGELCREREREVVIALSVDCCTPPCLFADPRYSSDHY